MWTPHYSGRNVISFPEHRISGHNNSIPWLKQKMLDISSPRAESSYSATLEATGRSVFLHLDQRANLPVFAQHGPQPAEHMSAAGMHPVAAR